MSESTIIKPKHFILQIIDEDLAQGKYQQIHTRFPPEPNGYLHIGHAKSICLNFGIAENYPDAVCNLRFDDTNPDKESLEYQQAIQQDVEWLGFQWHGAIRHASDYFDQLYAYAIELIEAGKAYVCDLSAEAMREYRGTLTEPGKNSPYRDRTIEENLDLFQRMRAGEFADGSKTLRAKIDMAAPNVNMRDPAIYRIKRAHHISTGDKWCIYPMYDYTHCISDAIEGISHSLCTLEFADHKPLYDWVLDNISIECHPQQIEFSRLELEYTITSKRKLTQLVDEDIVAGWDDPRMTTVSGLRRRGYTPAAIKLFCDRIGVTRKKGTVEMEALEVAIREDLDANAPRAMAVLNPLKITIENYPEDKVEILSGPRHPNKEEMGRREIPFTREIYIDREDFKEQANNKFKRLVLGKEVRLRNAYVIKAEKVIKDDEGNIQEIICSYDENTLGKNPEGRKVKGVIQWVSATEGKQATVRLYDRLFNVANPAAAEDVHTVINPDSLQVLENCWVEPSLAEASPEDRFQFEREGYFVADRHEYSADNLIFNRTVTLRDTWAKIQAKQ